MDYILEDVFNDVRENDYDAFVKLEQIFQLNVFYPVHIGDDNDWSVAYLMNDAVESFLTFTDSIMTGNYIDNEAEQIPDLQRLDEGYMLIVNQGGENTFTIKFKELKLTTHLFNYGCMGHFWIDGYEYLRQLEYQLADIRDKYRYLGEDVCSDKEMLLMKLADFPPIKRYRSVPEKYYVPYPDCVYEEAVDYLIKLAEKTGDCLMERILVSYKKKPMGIKSRIIARMLCGKRHAEFVDAIISELREAASIYPDRIFTTEENIQCNVIHKKALSTLSEYVKQGYKCLLYKEEPFMYSKDSITYKEHVLIFVNGLFHRKSKIVTFE